MRVPARIGQRLEEVDTPALILDLDAFERNLKTLAGAEVFPVPVYKWGCRKI